MNDQLSDGYDVVVVGGGAAAAAGASIAAQLNADLIAEETRQAVAAYRDPFSSDNEARICELVTGERRHGI